MAGHGNSLVVGRGGWAGSWGGFSGLHCGLSAEGASSTCSSGRFISSYQSAAICDLCLCNVKTLTRTHTRMLMHAQSFI